MSEVHLQLGDRTTRFEAQRRRLTGLAYRMLGSLSAAEDMVQESYLRWHRAELADPAAGAAWLTTTVTRLCIDHLRAQDSARRAYVGPWLPEPLVAEAPADGLAQVELAEGLSMAMMMVMEKLAPSERAAFLLHDVFDVDYDEIAGILELRPNTCRQMVSRARKRLRAERPRFESSEADRVRLLAGFVDACQTGNIDDLIALFAEDITLWTDGGGRVRAALNPITGADPVARFLIGVIAKSPAGLLPRPARINGEPGLLVLKDGAPFATLSLDADRDRIRGIAFVLNPDKLRHLCRPT